MNEEVKRLKKMSNKKVISGLLTVCLGIVDRGKWKVFRRIKNALFVTAYKKNQDRYRISVDS